MVGADRTTCVMSFCWNEFQVKSDCEAWTAQHIQQKGDLSVVAEDFKAWADSLGTYRRFGLGPGTCACPPMRIANPMATMRYPRIRSCLQQH